jgi:DNA repair protein RecO (recombination protein O)
MAVRAGTRACPYDIIMLTKDLAICIRAVDYSETSQIVTFFTKATGKISAIAKGSKRPKSAFEGPIEIFSHGRIVFSDSSDKSDSNREKLATLTEFESAPGEQGFAGLSSDLFALNCCFFAAELLNKLTHDYDPHPELFDSFLQFLQNANENNSRLHILALLILFQLALLRDVGLQPVLDRCVKCKSQYARGDTQYETYFSSIANGIICRDCEASFPDKIRLSQQAANCLGNLKRIAEAQQKTLNEIEKILIHHFTELLGHKPKMAKHILKS